MAQSTSSTGNQPLIELGAVDVGKRVDLPAANHVGASIGVADKPRREHVRNKLLHVLPTATLVVKPLDEGFAAHFPRCAHFVVLEAVAQLGPAFRIVGRSFFAREKFYVRAFHMVRVAAVELESVDVEIFLQLAQAGFQMV